MAATPPTTRSDEAQDTPPRDRHFDGFRAPRSDKAKAFVAEIVTQVENFEKRYRLRQRRRRPADQAIFEATVAAVICDLVHHHLCGHKGNVAISRSNRKLAVKSRYRPPALGATLPDILDRLSAPELAFVRQTMGERRLVWEGEGDEAKVYYERRATIIEPGPRLFRRIKENQFDLDDIGRADQEEVVVLKAPKIHTERPGVRLEYEDTPTTTRYREQVQAINRWLEDAELDFDGPESLGVDPRQRRLYRIFNNGSFEEGGRLFGGFWMELKKEVRRADITIDGEPVVELDYGQMALRLLYARAGSTPPPGDLYAIPGLEGSREGVKKILNSALYSAKEQTRFPQGGRDLFPRRLSYREVLGLVRERHAPVADQFFTGVGMRLMFEESEILISLLLALWSHGHVALPLHDGVLTARSSAPAVQEAMRQAFLERTGVEPVVRLE